MTDTIELTAEEAGLLIPFLRSEVWLNAWYTPEPEYRPFRRTPWAERACRRRCLATVQPDWGVLDGCFGRTTARPSDLDGIIVNRDTDAVLFIEWKTGDAVGLSSGQLGVLKKLATLPDCTAIIVYADRMTAPWDAVTGATQHAHQIRRVGPDAYAGGCSNRTLRGWIREWWATGVWPSADDMAADDLADQDRALVLADTALKRLEETL